MRQPILSAALIMLSIALNACKKENPNINDNDQKTATRPVCYLTHRDALVKNSYGWGDYQRIQYDSLDRMVELVRKTFPYDYYYNYVYRGDSIDIQYMRVFIGTGQHKRDTTIGQILVILNATGMPANMYKDQSHVAFHYTPGTNKISQSVSTDLTSGISQPTNYTWQNGDVIKIQTWHSTITLTYTNNLAQQGDPYFFEQMWQYGVDPIANEHLVQSSSTNGNIENFEYSFNADDYIDTAVGPQGRYGYRYICK